MEPGQEEKKNKVWKLLVAIVLLSCAVAVIVALNWKTALVIFGGLVLIVVLLLGGGQIIKRLRRGTEVAQPQTQPQPRGDTNAARKNTRGNPQVNKNT